MLSPVFYFHAVGKVREGIRLRFFAFLPESCEFNAFSGRSSDLSQFHKAFPFSIAEQWQVIYETIIVRTIGHHSSGYCCGFKPHSLFTARI